MTTRIHLDTDFAGDPDDACALALVLGYPGVDVVAVTTALEDDGGHRHDCLRYVLALVGRQDIPSASGVDETLTGRRFPCTWGDHAHWPVTPPHVPSAPVQALDLLSDSIQSGATIVAIGGFTNLAALEMARPGALTGARVVAMAGWIEDPPPAWPQWGSARDFNTQCDTRAALVVAASGASLTLVTMPVAMQAMLRSSDLGRLSEAGAIGEMLARQSAAHAETRDYAAIAPAHEALPDDLVNFHWDPVTAGVALGWDCIAVRSTNLSAAEEGGIVSFSVSDDAGPDAVAVAIDAAEFTSRWIRCVESLAATSG